MAKLWARPSYFNPHGTTDSAVHIAIGYSLPEEQPQAPEGEEYKFKDEKYNQTYLANLSTMVVDSKSKGKNSEIKNWLLNSSEGAHAGHGAGNHDNGHSIMNMGNESGGNSMMGMEDEITNPSKIAKHKGSQVTELLMNGAITLNERYTDIDFQYFDIDANNRGQGSLLLTQDDGDTTLMHLTKDALYHGEGDNRQATWSLQAEYFVWAEFKSKENTR